jgi:hypothetical protein
MKRPSSVQGEPKLLIIICRLAAQLRHVLRHTRNIQCRPVFVLGFIGGKEGHIVKAKCDDVIVGGRTLSAMAEEGRISCSRI